LPRACGTSRNCQHDVAGTGFGQGDAPPSQARPRRRRVVGQEGHADAAGAAIASALGFPDTASETQRLLCLPRTRRSDRRSRSGSSRAPRKQVSSARSPSAPAASKTATGIFPSRAPASAVRPVEHQSGTERDIRHERPRCPGARLPQPTLSAYSRGTVEITLAGRPPGWPAPSITLRELPPPAPLTRRRGVLRPQAATRFSDPGLVSYREGHDDPDAELLVVGIVRPRAPQVTAARTFSPLGT